MISVQYNKFLCILKDHFGHLVYAPLFSPTVSSGYVKASCYALLLLSIDTVHGCVKHICNKGACESGSNNYEPPF